MKFFQRRHKKANADQYGELFSEAFSAEMPPPPPPALRGPSQDLSKKSHPPSQEVSKELKNETPVQEEEDTTSISSGTDADDVRQFLKETATRAPSSSTMSTLSESPPSSPRGRRGMKREESHHSVAARTVTGQVVRAPQRDRRSSFKRITSQRSRNPRRRIHERKTTTPAIAVVKTAATLEK